MQNNAIESHWAALEGPVAERQSLEVWGFLRRRKSFIFVLAVVGAGILLVIIALVHFRVMPLDVAFFVALRKFGL